LRRQQERRAQEEARVEERRRQEQRARDNDQFRHVLLAHIRTEMAPARQELGDEFRSEREDVLGHVNREWRSDELLSERSMDDLLAPVREELERRVAALREVKEERLAMVEKLTERFDQAVLDGMAALITPEAKQRFTVAATKLYETHDRYWNELPIDKLREHGIDGYWRPPKTKLIGLYEYARKLDEPPSSKKRPRSWAQDPPTTGVLPGIRTGTETKIRKGDPQ
jgi:hypothetical protein